MLRYEILALSVPEITQDEAKQVETRLSRLIEGFKGTVISFERWGKFRLAYPVNNNDYGVYFLLRFELERSNNELMQEIKTIFAVKLNDVIMRYMLTKLDPKASLNYQRPHALEEAPGRDVESFIRDNKMDGILSMDKKRGAASFEDAEEEFAE
jgi:small subunit ribosomal protein S6